MNALKLFVAFFIAILHMDAIVAQESYVPGFINEDKPGDCRTDDNYPCADIKTDCFSDCECPKQQKCCYKRSCDKSVCENPLNVSEDPITCGAEIQETKLGFCPELLATGCPEKCKDECTSDCKCPGNKKCCKQPKCANRCVDPESSGGPTEIKNAKDDAGILRCARPCSSILDCDDEQKCCRQGSCGFVCVRSAEGKECK